MLVLLVRGNGRLFTIAKYSIHWLAKLFESLDMKYQMNKIYSLWRPISNCNSYDILLISNYIYYLFHGLLK